MHDDSHHPAPLVNAAGSLGDGRYVVVLKDGAAQGPVDSAARRVSAAATRAGASGGRVTSTFESALRGYDAQTIQRRVTWGLDRVDQRTATLNGQYFYLDHGSYVIPYVVDSGIQQQVELGSANTVVNTIGGTRTDCFGHGTHVAGIIGGRDFGVAKDSSPRGVKVLDCNGQGTTESVVKGLDWLVANHVTGAAVANLSLGGSAPGHDQAVEAAVRRVIADGVSVVVAAGNDDASACRYTPAWMPEVITVGASTKTDRRASFSNYGSCVDLYAPGTNILSNWIGRDGRGGRLYAVLSGTSMAAPFVTGAAKLYLERHQTATPAEVQTALLAAATPKAVKGLSAASPGRLLFAPPRIPTPKSLTRHPNRITYASYLARGQQICSPNGKYCLTYRTGDGHLVLRRASDGKVIWQNGVAGNWTRVTSQLITYNAYGKQVWISGEQTYRSSELRVRDRGYLALVRLDTGRTTWHTTPAE